MENSSFLAVAAKLGHSIDDLNAGKTVSSVISVSNVHDLKSLFNHGNITYPTAKNKAFGAVTKHTDALTALQAYIFNNKPLSANHLQHLQQIFPLSVQATSVNSYTCSAGETNFGNSGTPVVLNFNTLTMQDQSFITVYNTVFTLNASTVIRNGVAPSGRRDINILGADGSPGMPGQSVPPMAEGSPGSAAGCDGGFFGPNIATPGGTGGNGITGMSGGYGGEGLPSQAANITFNDIQAKSFSIYTQPGNGGIGGGGGTGGQGGQGGQGGDGVVCNSLPFGNPPYAIGGANGGTGGTGGPGGNGGTGGLPAYPQGDIYITVPAAQMKLIQTTSVAANGGKGGPAGAGGAGGPGGYGGAGAGQYPAGQQGAAGQSGAPGAPGFDNTQTNPGANIHVVAR